jgi:AraC-like DNA-binding protein
LVHLFLYLLFTARIIQKHRRFIKQSHSSIEKIKLSWLLYLILAFASILVTYILFVYFIFAGKNTFTSIGRIFTLWEPLIVFFIGYKGLTQTEIFSEKLLNQNNKKYVLSNLTQEMSVKYRQTLLRYIKEKKPYLNSELTIKELSEQLSIPSRYLSQLLNETFKQNFFDFINRFRVEEAKTQLGVFKNKSILQIAFESGFNSKTAFNTAFKKYSGETPSQYRQQQQKVKYSPNKQF